MNNANPYAPFENLSDQEKLAELWNIPEDGDHYVLNVLTMFRQLQRSYFQLKAAERDGIDFDSLRFLGFDAKDEYHELGIARSIVCDRGLFPESNANIAGAGLDSHCPMRERYGRMLKVWRPMRDRQWFERDDLVRIAAESVHPEHRQAGAATA